MLSRMTQTMRLTLTAGMLALPTLTLADIPPVLDRVTTEASIVVATSNISSALAGFEALGEMGLGDFGEVTGVISSIGGLNMDGSAALGVFITEDMGVEGPDMFMVLPVSDYGELLESLDGEGQGVAEVFIEGTAMYLSDIGGGFAIVGSTKAMAEKYGDVRGSTAAFEALLGDAGQDAAEASTIFVAANLGTIRPFLRDAMEEVVDSMETAAQMQGPAMAPMIDIYRTLGEHVVDEGQSITFGVGFEDAGISIHTAAQFTEGSEAAALLTGEVDSSAMLARVPNKPFFMAMAADMSGGLFKAASDFGMAMQQMQAEAMGIDAPEIDTSLFSGYAAVVGTPAGGLMGGLLTATTVYTASKDPKAILAMKSTRIEQMSELAIPMVGLDGSYTKGATTIAGHEVDSWSLGFEFDNADPSMMQFQMIIPMLFGPGGLGGFSTTIDGGVVETMSQNPRLMEAAIEAATNGGGLSTNESIASVSKYLPENRAFEFYIGAEEVFTMAGALAAMGQLPMDFDLPDGVAPIAAGLGYSNGGAHSSLFVPIEVIEFGSQMAGMLGGMGGDF